MNPGWPSGSTSMFALFEWPGSGKPPEVSAPSWAWAITGSSPPGPPASKLPDSSSNPIGGAARWSWKRLTNQKSWVAA